jgi:hypothetical protein
VIVPAGHVASQRCNEQQRRRWPGRREEGRVAHWHPNDEELKTSNMTNDARFILPRSQYNSKGPKYTLIRYRLIVQVGGRCYGATVQALNCRAALSCASATLLSAHDGPRNICHPAAAGGLWPAYLDGSQNRKPSISICICICICTSAGCNYFQGSGPESPRGTGQGHCVRCPVSSVSLQPSAFRPS